MYRGWVGSGKRPLPASHQKWDDGAYVSDDDSKDEHESTDSEIKVSLVPAWPNLVRLFREHDDDVQTLIRKIGLQDDHRDILDCCGDDDLGHDSDDEDLMDVWDLLEMDGATMPVPATYLVRVPI